MISRLLLSLALASTLALAQAAPEMASRVAGPRADIVDAFRAPQVEAVEIVHLSAPPVATTPVVERGRLRIGTERPLAKAAGAPDWVQAGDGAVNRFRATSEGAAGLRLRLEVPRLSAPLEIRAQGGDGRVEAMQVFPGQPSEVWTPWTDGPTQTLELFVPAGAPIPSVSVVGVTHFDESPLMNKATASSCTVPVACSTGDATLDAAIAERKNSSVRIIYSDGGKSFACSATLINTERFPMGFLVTANHCVSTAASANSVTSFFFYQGVSCEDPTLWPNSVQRSGGTVLVFTNHNADSTLLQMNASVPTGASYAGWNATQIASGESIVSISHPHADTTRLATGRMGGLLRITDRSQDEYGVTMDRGIIEGGSSGSGLYTLANGSLQLRGVLTGSTIRSGDPMTCTNTTEQALYGRLDIFGPEIAQYVRASGPASDDTPNRVSDWLTISPDTPLNNRSASFDRVFELVGDVDVFRFRLDAQASVTLATEGGLDTVGTLMDSEGKSIETNDDVRVGNLNFGITRTLDAGTYYVMVAPWDPQVVGSYRVVMTATTSSVPGSDPGTANYTDLWWNPNESGWGVNLNHQGNIVFATLYTYDATGQPMWLFMSNGDKQQDGSYSGPVYRATGSPFNASPWGGYTATQVGTMRIAFSSNTAGTLTYSVNGTVVTKNITRYMFSNATTCTWTTGDRTTATNYQDLWWNPSESGWGVNLAHQGNILFATMYTYDLNGQGLWLSMSNGALVAPRTYQGTLYRSTGPAFNANPWGAYQLQAVGTMTVSFADGNTGSLTYTVNGIQVAKSIRRFVFSNPVPLCSSS